MNNISNLLCKICILLMKTEICLQLFLHGVVEKMLKNCNCVENCIIIPFYKKKKCSDYCKFGSLCM